MIETVRRALDLLGREQRKRLFALIVLAIAVSGFEMLGGVLVFVLIGLVADPSGRIEVPIVGDVRSLAGAASDRTLLLSLIGLMAVFFGMRAALQIGSIYVQKRVANNAGARLSNYLVAGYLKWPYEAHLNRNSSEFVRNGQVAVEQLVNGVFVPVIAASAEMILMLGMLALMIVVAPAATALAAVVIAGAAALVLFAVQPRLKRLGRLAHEMQGETLREFQQSLEGIRDIKVLGRERYFARRYAKNRLRLARTSYLKDTLSQLPHAAIELSLFGVILALFAVNIQSNVRDALPTLGLFAYAGMRLQPSVKRTMSSLNNIRFSSAPLEDLHADLQVMKSLKMEHEDSIIFKETLTLEGVTFRYQGSDQDALSDVNLTVRVGEQIGICGPTGSGKTTLIDLIVGFLEPTQGRLLIDGQPLNELTRGWQSQLGVVSQMVVLLDDTMRRNVALGVPDEEIDHVALIEALELAQLTDFVASLPNGLDSLVGERGMRLSGGQRQRIAIARALYRRPAVLIFDEGTSALDNTTESQLMEAIARLRGKHTIVLVAHRLSTVRQSDRIVYIEGGRISGEGTFEVLISENENFRRLAASP